MMNTKSKAVLAFLFIFIAGFASGFLLNQSISSSDRSRTDRTDQINRGDRGERDERQISRARERLANMLDLTDDQQDPFFENFSQYRSNLRSEIREQRIRENEILKEHYEIFKNELSELLNAEQLIKLDQQLHPDSVRHFRSRGSNFSGRRGDE